MIPKNPPARDDDYKAYVASFPCMILTDGKREEALKSPCIGQVCAHHIRRRVECSDYETVPLCANHHVPGVHTMGKKTFQRKFGIDFKKKVAELNKGWDNRS